MSNLKKQFIKNACSGWLAQLSAAIVGFIMLPYNLHYLGKEVYGISVLAVSAIAMLDFLSLGMGPALLRFFSQSIAKNDKEEIGVISSTSQLILGGLGLLGGVIILIGIPWFLRFYEIASEHHHETAILLICLAATFFQKFHTMVFSYIITASHRFDLINFNGIFSSWLRMGLLVLFYKIFTPSLIGLGLATILANTFNYFVTIGVSFLLQGICVCFSLRNVVFSRFPSLFVLSFWTMLNNFCFVVSIQVPLMIIGKTLSKDMAAYFTPAILITTYFSSILGQISVPLTSIATHDFHKNQGKKLHILAVSMGQVSSCFGHACICFLIIFIKDIVFLWLGDGFIWTSSIIIVMAIGMLYTKIQFVNYSLALGVTTVIPIVCVSIFTAFIVSIVTWFGTVNMEWGLWYVSIGVTLTRILCYTFYPSWAYSKLFSYKFLYYLIQVYVKPLSTCFIVLILFIAIQYFVVLQHVPRIYIAVLGSILAITLYCFITWFWVLAKETKSLFLK
ncbi:MAG: hypothetical protein LBT05_00310 [Planctomycetaceae bacterium]|jgi:membrane protein EpsK|nr:hypothetical protein [Planctomycetaceae bacterium]